MTRWHTLIKFRGFSSLLLGALIVLSGQSNPSDRLKPPSDAQWDGLVGETLPQPVSSVVWRAGEPPQSNLVVYAADQYEYRPELLKSIATAVGISGDVQPLPDSILYAPGYWIKELNPTNKETWKALIYSKVSGMIRYTSGEDNHKWDLKNHKPLATGVPSEQEALRRTMELLPALGITTNELEHLQDGTLRYACNDEGTLYNDRYDEGKRKRYIRQINIEVSQKIQDDASVLSVGSGGMLRVGFISDGHLAELEMTFRKIRPIGQASPKSSRELISMLKKGDGRTFRQSIPSTVTITNCTLVYPEANSITKQNILWPVYALNGFAVEDGETNAVHIYEPLLP